MWLMKTGSEIESKSKCTSPDKNASEDTYFS